jgi:hypothetical protein
VRRLLRSSALALLFATVMPQAPADLFVYASAQAADPAIPSWVAASCCGPKDLHHLRPDQVTDMGNYYVVDGYNSPVRKTWGNGTLNDQIKPSQDGGYWAFFSTSAPGWTGSPEATHETWEDARQSFFCLFIPMAI